MKIAVRCTEAKTETVGTFIHHGDRVAVSPIFDGLYQLLPWMKENGYFLDEYPGGNFDPWRVSKDETAELIGLGANNVD